MLRTRLLTATAAVALFAAGSALAQTAPAPAQVPAQSAVPATPATPATPAEPAQSAPATPAAPASPAQAVAGAETPAAANTVVDVLRANGQFTTLLGALDAAQLTDTLNSQPAISIFAPTDAAFAALPEAERTRLMDPANVNDLRQLLLYHVVVADVNSSQIEGAKGGVETAATTEVQLDGTGDSIKVDNATVTTADIDASNGAIFIIDRVLNPAESQVAAGDAETTAPADTTDTPDATPPVDDDVDGTTPPVADDSIEGEADGVTDEDMDAGTSTDDGDVAPPPTAAAPATTPSTPSATRSTPGTVNAPNGQPATSVTTTASPPVPNPTDGQVDDEDEDEAGAANTKPATNPTPQS